MFLSLSSGAIVGIVIAVIALIIILWFIGTNNSLKRMNIECDEALSGIDVALEKRYDTLTKLLDTTKGYAKHESETLMKTIQMRTGASVKDLSADEKVKLDSALNAASKELNVVVERYPELKADGLFKQLMTASMDVEEHLQASRRIYNSNVRTLNEAIVVFPSSIVANMLHIKKREFFEVSEGKRNDVKMEF